jgi:hypothetical protein
MIWKHYAAWIPARQAALDEHVQKANGWHRLEVKSETLEENIQKACLNSV